ncbi:hypothetical protein [Mucisphaera calidilacus]|uniref:Uncharacterized protein n=1 Tax=Mucisphaera calidilacus TaxID=2527982 RepID=A0A518BWN0_9BACT|nr:hypothetical protein [Mucisphaera calidilacus]QDU71379.1 hypothetical protein Pan265_12280 [Mucisphaera calidilacus]
MSARSPVPGVWQKMRTTPMKDWIRGRLSGRYDWKWVIVSAAIPEPCRGLVREVVGRSGLWRREKADVARELVAHFADGVEAGASAEELVERFGDVRQAARLIRRAKKRQRSVVYHARVLVGRVVGVTAVLYVAAILWFMMGEPRPRENIIALMNASVDAQAERDQAWPELRALMLSGALHELEASGKLDPEDVEDQVDGEIPNHVNKLKPDGRLWPLAEAYLAENAATLERLRALTAYPYLGFRVGFEYDMEPDDWRAMNNPTGNEASGQPEAPDWDSLRTEDRLMAQSTLHVLLPHLSIQRQIARSFRLAMRDAAARGDGEAFVAYFMATGRLAAWSAEQPFLISELVKVSIQAYRLEELRAVLRDDPGLLTDSQLVALAHELAVADVSVVEGIYFERDFFMEDYFDRIYSPSGWMTDEGVLVLANYDYLIEGIEGSVKNTEIAMRMLQSSSTPLVAAVIAPRWEMERVADAYYEQIIEASKYSLAELHEFDLGEQIVALSEDPYSLYGVRYFPVVMLMPALEGVLRTEGQTRSVRDAVVIRLAAEVFKREHGRWPADQAAMVPGYLPRVYADASDLKGRPYLLRAMEDGDLMVYGRGLDGDDDGGRVDETTNWPRLPELDENDELIDCDWVLYPEP